MYLIYITSFFPELSLRAWLGVLLSKIIRTRLFLSPNLNIPTFPAMHSFSMLSKKYPWPAFRAGFLSYNRASFYLVFQPFLACFPVFYFLLWHLFYTLFLYFPYFFLMFSFP